MGLEFNASLEEGGAVRNFKELSNKARTSILLCFFLGICMFATIVVISLNALAEGWLDNSIFTAVLLGVFLLVAFIVIIFSQYYLYRKKRWDYFVGISASITESR